MFETIMVISFCVTVICCTGIVCGVGFKFRTWEFWLVSGLRNAEIIKKQMDLQMEETPEQRRDRLKREEKEFDKKESAKNKK